jgi:enamine deaminase RidA (YjgF/YER057c/UK114 family)
MAWTAINPGDVPPPVRNRYSHAARVDLQAGPLLFVSGQMALDENGAAIGPGDLERQSEVVFRRLAAILADQGATFGDVVSIRTYLTDMSDLSGYASARTRHLTGTPPTSTTVGVQRLVHPDALVEVDVVAVLPNSTAS